MPHKGSSGAVRVKVGYTKKVLFFLHFSCKSSSNFICWFLKDLALDARIIFVVVDLK